MKNVPIASLMADSTPGLLTLAMRVSDLEDPQVPYDGNEIRAPLRGESASRLVALGAALHHHDQECGLARFNHVCIGILMVAYRSLIEGLQVIENVRFSRIAQFLRRIKRTTSAMFFRPANPLMTQAPTPSQCKIGEEIR